MGGRIFLKKFILSLLNTYMSVRRQKKKKNHMQSWVFSVFVNLSDSTTKNTLEAAQGICGVTVPGNVQ